LHLCKKAKITDFQKLIFPLIYLLTIKFLIMEKKCFKDFAESEFNHLTFKIFKDDYKRTSLPETHVKFVDEEEFLKEEKDCIPLFVSSQFGILTAFKDRFDEFNGRLVALYQKSVLSGTVIALIIAKMEKGEFVRIKYFENDHGLPKRKK